MMIDWVASLSIACAAGLCALTGWVALTPRIHDGAVVKTGLLMASVSLAGIALITPRLAADPALRPMLHALLIGDAGVMLAAGGVAWRIYRCPDALAAVVSITGWPGLDEMPRDPLA